MAKNKGDHKFQKLILNEIAFCFRPGLSQNKIKKELSSLSQNFIQQFPQSRWWGCVLRIQLLSVMIHQILRIVPSYQKPLRKIEQKIWPPCRVESFTWSENLNFFRFNFKFTCRFSCTANYQQDIVEPEWLRHLPYLSSNILTDVHAKV